MKRCSRPCPLLFTAFALAALPAGLGAQDESLISESQLILQPGTPPAIESGPLKRLISPRTPTETPDTSPKRSIGVRPGSLPLAVAIQPDARQKYGTNPAVLQLCFRHRH